MVTLKPKTKRGRQIVKEFGDQWDVKMTSPELPMGRDKWLFCMPAGAVHPTTAGRWIRLEDDEHFEVIR